MEAVARKRDSFLLKVRWAWKDGGRESVGLGRDGETQKISSVLHGIAGLRKQGITRMRINTN
jgi:hypothetical protein